MASLDYVGILPGVAAMVMGAIMATSKELPRWKRAAVILLTTIAVATTGVSQWWSLAQKKQEQAQRTLIREQLGQFQAQGSELLTQTRDLTAPLPIQPSAEWAAKVEEFLTTKLGPSYVIRFRSAAGLPLPQFTSMPQDRDNLWTGIFVRMARLEQFASEISR